MRWTLVALMAGLLLSACGSEAAETAENEPCPNHSAATSRGNASELVLRPAKVSAGDRFTATFPDAKGRDSLLWLSVQTDGGCVRTFYSAGRNSVPEWEEVTNAGQFSVLGSEVRGRVVPGIVPPVAPAGTYEVCGGGADVAEVCGHLLVMD